MTRALPIPDAALASHLAILGKTGAGKSYAARSTVERILHRGERACIVDPTGVWWGLRLDAKGKPRAGFPVVIAGGRHGDVPLSEGDGAALARIVGTTSTPMILDTSGLTVGARTRLFTAFAEALIVENTGPLHLVLDEAHLFAPQTRVPDPQSAMMVHAANSLVALGRARGLRIMLLTQRPAKLHKDTLTQVETLVAMRLLAPQDRKAVEEWIVDQADKKRGAEIVASLPALKTGEAWVWSPDAGLLERVAFPTIVTFDSMRPEAQGAYTLAPIEVGAVRAALAVVDEPAPATRARKAPQDEIEAAEKRGYERGFQEGLRCGGDYAKFILEELGEAVEPIRLMIERRLKEVSTGRWSPPPAARSVERPRATEAPRSSITPEPAAARASDTVSPARQRILDAIAWFESIGTVAPAREIVAFIAGASSISSSFANNLGVLRSAGLVDYPEGGLVALTDAGRAGAVCPSVRLTTDAIAAAVRDKIPPAQSRLLDVLIAAYPSSTTREDLAAAASVSSISSSFANNLGRLRALGLLTYPAGGSVRAADLLFPERP